MTTPGFSGGSTVSYDSPRALQLPLHFSYCMSLYDEEFDRKLGKNARREGNMITCKRFEKSTERLLYQFMATDLRFHI